jgi:pyruvate dehydrogenase E2 component (dihydrolipoamide acetyltransferase)
VVGAKATTTAGLQGFEERWAELDGVAIRYFVAGEGEPILLVHGLGGGASNWVLVAPSLARRSRVLAVDLPGHGGSAALPRASGLSAFSERLKLLLVRERAAPALVVGHSLGGAVALQLAATYPEAVRALALVGSAGARRESPAERAVVAVAAIVRPGRFIAPWRTTIARDTFLRTAVFGGWGSPHPAALSAEAVEGLLAPQLLHTDTRTASRALLAGPLPDLGRIRCPSLVLWGARDRIVPLDDGFSLARRLRAPLRTVADTGHLLIVERPDAVLDALGWLSDRVRQLDEPPVETESLG